VKSPTGLKVKSNSSFFLLAMTAAFVALFLFCAVAPVRAAIMPSGDVKPGGTWDNSTYGYVGHTSDGMLLVNAGSVLASNSANIGYRNGVSGTVTVTGSGSAWSNTADIYIGYRGSGTLSIEAGGQVSSSSGYLGWFSGSTGSAAVSGLGSKWTNSGELYVGQWGNGSLTVSDGGTVTTGSLFASLGDLHGNGTIAATGGAVLDAELRFDAAHPTQATIAFGTGGILTMSAAGGNLGAGYKGSGGLTIAEGKTVNSSRGFLGYNAGSNGSATVTGTGSKWTTSSALFIGCNGSGTLSIEAGGQVSSPYGSVGDGLGSTGSVTVRGVGSKWTNSYDLHVGYSGSGALSIEGGGQVTSSSGYLGTTSGSTGSVTVTGTGSKWTNSTDLYVGQMGSGSLTVADGGQVTTKTLYASLSDLHGNGTITASGGAVLDGELTFDAAHSPQAAISFGSGGTLAASFVGGLLGVGYKGSGSLTVAEGITVADSSGYLGYNAGSTGSATVTGVGSKWTNTSLYVGYGGNGMLSIEAGGLVSSSSGDLGYNSGSTGSVTVSGLGSKWTNSSSLYVGDSGSGTLSIGAGGQVSSSVGYLGTNSGSTGSVTVTGTGSKWTNSGDLYVGQSGSGSLTVADGGQITTKTLYALLSDLHGNGTITASGGAVLDGELTFDAAHSPQAAISFGSGGTLAASFVGGLLGVGYKGSGSLTVAEGITVADSSGYMGYNAGSAGSATVTGANSKWTNSSSLYVGYCGSGTLSIEAGGQVSSRSGYVGYNAGSIGSVAVNGLGATWTNGSSLYVGYSGSGTLSIEAGGQVSSAAGYLGYNAGSIGSVAVNGLGATWTNGSSLYVGYSGIGTLSIEAGGQVSSSNGYLGANSGSTGSVTVTGTASKWTNSGNLYVGQSGSGSLTVAYSGQVTTGTLYASLSDLHGNGMITASKGAVLDGELRFDAAHPSQATLKFGSDGTLTVNAAGGDLGTGYKGSGSLNVAEGVTITSSVGYLGYKAGSTGSATVTGANSKWTNSSSLYVGQSGSGTLSIDAGGQVSSASGYMGYNAGSIGTALVTGVGSKWTNTSSLSVGGGGNGALRIDAGAEVSNAIGYIANNSSKSSGSVTVTGVGSKWTNSSALYVGYHGSGTLQIDGGGQVSNTSGYVGHYTGSIGSVAISGLGSKWTNSSSVYVGYGGNGVLSIKAGGLLSGSSLGLCVGYSGSGTLSIGAGGQVSSASGNMGANSGSTGSVTVTGTDSKWTNSGSLAVGTSGAGTLNIRGGGSVTAASVSVNSSSIVAVDVGYGSTFNVSGTITNGGKVQILAGAGLTDGSQYSPIAATTWSGSGTYQAIGGTWDANSHVFTVSPALAGVSGAPVAIDLAQKQRVLVGDGQSGETVGVSLLAKSGASTSLSLTASVVGGDRLTDLQGLLDPGQSVVEAWDLVSTGSGFSSSDPVYLSLAVGHGYSPSDLSVWRFEGAAWKRYSALDLTCNDRYASFTSTGLSTYAVVVPEPSVLVLLVGGAGAGILTVVRRRQGGRR
jgi:T5SS/PEP-CTERM-associated repeat protein